MMNEKISKGFKMSQYVGYIRYQKSLEGDADITGKRYITIHHVFCNPFIEHMHRILFYKKDY